VRHWPLKVAVMQLRPHSLPVGFIAPCLPSSAPQPPSGAEWLHEIKHEGFRVIARKDDRTVKLYSRPSNDLTDRFPLIVEALAKLRPLDGDDLRPDPLAVRKATLASLLSRAATGLRFNEHMDEAEGPSCSRTPAR
jgi:ATP-dependent DNA ligase